MIDEPGKAGNRLTFIDFPFVFSLHAQVRGTTAQFDSKRFIGGAFPPFCEAKYADFQLTASLGGSKHKENAHKDDPSQ